MSVYIQSEHPSVFGFVERRICEQMSQNQIEIERFLDLLSFADDTSGKFHAKKLRQLVLYLYKTNNRKLNNSGLSNGIEAFLICLKALKNLIVQNIDLLALK